jgi:hypothetical protein
MNMDVILSRLKAANEPLLLAPGLRLDKAAEDRIRARMEKEAGLEKLFTPIMRFFGRGGHAPGRLSQTASTMWQHPWLSAAGIGTAGAAGTIGYGHLSNAANEIAGHAPWKPLGERGPWFGSSWSLNPARWFGGGAQDEEQAFKYNNERYKPMREQMDAQISAAHSTGNHAEANRLIALRNSGNYGGGYRMFGLNPLANRNAGHYGTNARNIQQNFQNRLDAQRGQAGPQPGDQERIREISEQMQTGNFLPHEQRGMQQELDAIRARMQQEPGSENDESRRIISQMTGAGMNPRAFQHTAVAGGLPAHWNLASNGQQPWMPNPWSNDHRQGPRMPVMGGFGGQNGAGDAWEQIMRSGGGSNIV